MKVSKVLRIGHEPIIASYKRAFIGTLLGYTKTYDLLHKQIWRKSPERVVMWDNPLYTYHNNRPVKFVRYWNIKSSSTAPYAHKINDDYNGGNANYGLNAAFENGDPFVAGGGNLADMDVVWIQPKTYHQLSGLRQQWTYAGGWGDDTEEPIVVWKHNENGDILVDNVTVETYDVVANGRTITYARLRLTKNGSADRLIELGVATRPLSVLQRWLVFRNSNSTYVQDKAQYEASLEAKNGKIIYQGPTEVTSNWNWKRPSATDTGYIIVFRNGVTMEYVPYQSEAMGDGGYNDYPAHYKVLPMIYTDTGDLAMPRVKFVDEWDDMFELYYYKKRSKWERMLGLVLAIVTVVIAVYTGYYVGIDTWMGMAIVAGGVLSGIGILTANQTLMKIGGIIGAVGGIGALYQNIATSFVSNASASMATSSTAAVGLETAGLAQGVVAAGPSAAGYGNLLAHPGVLDNMVNNLGQGMAPTLTENYFGSSMLEGSLIEGYFGAGTSAVGLGGVGITSTALLPAVNVGVWDYINMGLKVFGLAGDLLSFRDADQQQKTTGDDDDSNVQILCQPENDENVDPILSVLQI